MLARKDLKVLAMRINGDIGNDEVPQADVGDLLHKALELFWLAKRPGETWGEWVEGNLEATRVEVVKLMNAVTHRLADAQG